jgi:hypothetical protein
LSQCRETGDPACRGEEASSVVRRRHRPSRVSVVVHRGQV